MSKVAIVYFSATGNTKEMAKYVAEGVRDAGAGVVMYTAADFRAVNCRIFDGIIFGCPARGNETLEENVFRPLWENCKGRLYGKRVGLFGSYGFGGGVWMQKWEKECDEAGINLASLSVICKEAPDDTAKKELRILGAAVAGR
ncbi:MAG: flavodoxin domain-containing protein [Eubacteriales bacterium]|nr:flavodoxin domain-containing protein [Eubacteriales bacterium]